MKKLMRKKISVFGKSIPVFVIVLLGLAVVSAALLPYFAQITGNVTVSQSVLFDNVDINGASAITEDMNGVAGNIFHEADHNLRNNANTWVLVDFASAKVGPAEKDTEGAGLTVYPEFKLVPTTDGDGDNDVGDEDDVHFYFGDEESGDMQWSAFNSVSFNYNKIDGPSDRVPHVNAWLRSPDGVTVLSISTWNGGSPNPTISEDGKTATYTKSQFVTSAGGASVATGYDDWEIREVRIQSGNPGADPSADSDLQVVYVSNVKVNDGSIGNVIELPTSDYANVPGAIVEFRMVYGFEYNSYPGEYTTTTEVDYTGIITESGVLITDTR